VSDIQIDIVELDT